jgi:hypothetical protein
MGEVARSAGVGDPSVCAATHSVIALARNDSSPIKETSAKGMRFSAKRDSLAA